MTAVPRPFPAAQPHGELREIVPDVYFVTGTVKLPGPLPVRFSRNMTVLREGGRLILVNAVRLDDAGLAALDRSPTCCAWRRTTGWTTRSTPSAITRRSGR
jgi:hypothetical protein